MFKLVYLLRRKNGMSPEEFHDYWRHRHAPLVRKHAAVLGIRRYVQSHTVDTDLNEWLVVDRRVDAAPYDGVAELWYDSEDSVRASLQLPEVRAALRELIEDERRFVDEASSPLWWTEELELVSLEESSRWARQDLEPTQR